MQNVSVDTSNNSSDIIVLNADGSYDTAFSSDGVLEINISDDDKIGDLDIDPDGTYIVCGQSYVNADNLMVAKIDQDGSFVSDFGNNFFQTGHCYLANTAIPLPSYLCRHTSPAIIESIFAASAARKNGMTHPSL